MDVNQAIGHALDGRAILFTGAGFSFGATNILSRPIPAGKALARMLLDEVGYSGKESSLDKASAAYLRRKSRRDLVDLLTKQFSVRDITQSHMSIASIPWRRVYTTNYDSVFEDAAKRASVVCNSVDAIDSPRDTVSKKNLIVHINGAIARLTDDRLDSTFKLVSESYAAESFENSEWAFHFRNDIRSSAAVIFVGYSMYDLDIRRILYSEDISDKCIFVVAPVTPDSELDVEDLADLGIVDSTGIDQFAKAVNGAKFAYIPQETVLLLDAWTSRSAVTSAVALPSDGEVLNWLVEGDLNPAMLLEACGANSGQYVVPRPSFQQAIAALDISGSWVAIVGALGSGKSFVCACLLQVFASRGWTVFALDIASTDEIAEVQEICEQPGKKLLHIENFHRHIDLLKWLVEANPQDVTVLLTERAHIHDLFASELYDLAGDRLHVIDVSRFDKAEVASAVALFNRYGLWGDRTAWSVERKERFVVIDCKGRLPFLLVDVLQSKHVTDRYKSLLSEVSNRGDVEELLICVFALDVMGFATSVALVEELLANRVRWAMLRSQVALKPIVDFDSRAVRAKSAVLANHLLHSIFTPKAIVDTLVGMAREADLRRRDKEFLQVSNNLMRYRNISAILPETKKLESTINYYEGVKNLLSARRNPQFWLQYAIACLAFGELKRAERYFDDAYSLVRSVRDYDTYMIDNHYARLLLEKALLVPNLPDSLLLIEDAKKTILRQMNTEVRYYPYRVALRLFTCYERFLTSWNQAQIDYFARMFSEIKRRCEAATGELKDNRYVTECLRRSEAALTAMRKP